MALSTILLIVLVLMFVVMLLTGPIWPDPSWII
jgi:hypothetical protein